MGLHMNDTYREASRQKSMEYIDLVNHILALRERLKHISLSEFTPDDLPTLFRIMDNRSIDPTKKELEKIERKLDDLMFGP